MTFHLAWRSLPVAWDLELIVMRRRWTSAAASCAGLWKFIPATGRPFLFLQPQPDNVWQTHDWRLIYEWPLIWYITWSDIQASNTWPLIVPVGCDCWNLKGLGLSLWPAWKPFARSARCSPNSHASGTVVVTCSDIDAKSEKIATL